MRDTQVDEFIGGYIDCALWSSQEEGENWAKGLHKDAWDLLASYARVFAHTHYSLLVAAIAATNNTWSQAGHDLWLSHNGHGAGYWDGDWDMPCSLTSWGADNYGDALTAAAKVYPELSLCLGDDGFVWVS